MLPTIDFPDDPKRSQYDPLWLMFAACAMKDLFCRIGKRTDASA